MTAISTHVLDLARGVPASGVSVELLAGPRGSDPQGPGSAAWMKLGTATTDQDGRAVGLAGPGGAPPGLCRLVFAIGPYQRGLGEEPFLEEAVITFTVGAGARLHIPLLLSPFGMSIYRGS